MDELARLIDSLTKSEKRYFKLFTSMQSGEKGYLKLFEAIDKMGEYDEERIRKMFQGEDFLKRLPAVKNYLYSMILKSLRTIYSGNSVESQLREMLEEVAILYERRLYKQCSRILEKAKALATTNEQMLALIEINMWLEKVQLEYLPLDKFERVLENSLQEEMLFLDLQKNIAQYKNLYNRIVLINRKIKEARTEEELRHFQEIIDHPLLKSIDRALSFDARHYFYHIHLIYNHAKGDNASCFVIAEKQLKLIESSPERIAEKPKMYITALNNMLLCQVHLHRYEHFEEVIKKLRDLPVRSLNLEVNRFVSSYLFEMVKYLDTGEFHKSIGMREGMIQGLEKYRDQINAIEETTLLYNLFYSYFGTQEYSKALSIINRLLNEYEKELRDDIQSAVRILNLILHYELGNLTLLEYNAVSTYRFLYKSKRLYKLENIVLDFIRKKMPDIHSKKEQMEAFRQLRKEFVALSEHPFEKKAFEYFDYISWLDSKLEEKSFEQVVKEKFLLRTQEKPGKNKGSK